MMTPWVKGQPMVYKCSLCQQPFVLPDDRSPKEGATEVWAAFLDHVKEEHAQNVEN